MLFLASFQRWDVGFTHRASGQLYLYEGPVAKAYPKHGHVPVGFSQSCTCLLGCSFYFHGCHSICLPLTLRSKCQYALQS